MNATSRSRGVALLAAVVAGVLGLAARPAQAYLKLGFEIDGRFILLKWSGGPVRYFVTSQGGPGVTAVEFQAAVSRAFTTWANVPTATISYEFGGVTSARPGDDDGRSTLGFRAAPELDRVLASTSFLVDAVTGELIESDVFFNTEFDWSVAAAGSTSRYDIEIIALHEIGHMSGLGHSAIGETEMANGGRRVIAAESVMFPIAFRPGGISNRTLRADDVAGISDLYPEEDGERDHGSISGRVTKNGQGVFGAHVVAYNPATDRLVGTFSLNSMGQFAIAGLDPGPHVLRVEPLDDADVESFFEARDIDIDFRATFHDRLVVVPRGGDSRTVTITVVPK